METFFEAGDYEEYLSLMRQWGLSSGLEILAYCLMPNHVHLIVVPESTESLARGIGEAHRRYTRYITTKKAGRDICGRVVLLRFQWMRIISWQQCDMLS
jgi:putative transposase